MPSKVNRPKVLAIASGGGHWEQMMLLKDAFAETDVSFATTLAGLAEHHGIKAHLVPDCNRNQPLKVVHALFSILFLILRLRPNAIISTGALPGVIALAIGRKLGARTLWIDSVANAEELSMAGKAARKHADLWATQWPNVAEQSGARYYGSVL